MRRLKENGVLEKEGNSMKNRANTLLLKSSVLTAGLLGALVGVAPPRAQAAEETPMVQPFEIGIFGGLHFYDKKSGLGRYTVSDEGYSPDLGGAFGLRLGYNFNRWVGLEAEGMISPTHTRYSNPVGTREIILGYRGQVIVTFIHSGYVRPFALVGWGALSELPKNSPGPNGEPFKDTDDVFHAGVGAKFPFTDYFGLRLDGRIMFPPAAFASNSDCNECGFHGPDYEILLAAYLGFGGTRPLPPPPPALPAPPPKDTDGDGIPDVDDACPTEPGPASNDPKKNGCPRPKDTDGDGILDVDDACPTEPGPKSDDPTKNGCPPPKDTDGDGIPDNIDKCPNEPETFNGYQDEDGCPDEVPAAIRKFTGVVEGINFKTNSADITKASYPVLDKAVQVLTDYQDIRFEISGHTDNVGKADHNKELSQKRAVAVKQYFVERGIRPERLTAVGFGAENPIADNKTSAGRAKNRRTEFKLLTGN